MEDTYRWLMMLIAAPFLALIHLNFVRIKPTRATFYHPNEPLLLAAAVRLCVVPAIGGMLLYMLEPAFMRWSSLPLPAAVRLAGAPLLLAAEFVFCWSLWSLGRNFSVSLAVFSEHRLIQHGPYRWVRHPMYASIMAMCPALFVLTANWFIAGALALAIPLVVLFRTPLEERTLHGRFGARYGSYAERTGRYWPLARAAYESK